MVDSLPAAAGAGPLPLPVEAGLRLGLVAVVAGLFGLALLLDLAGGALTLGGLAVPDLCLVKRLWGIPCPGCGLTRSWVAMLGGDLAASLRFHGLGAVTLVYAGAQALRHAAWLAFPRRRRELRWGRALDGLGLALLGLLFARWLLFFV